MKTVLVVLAGALGLLAFLAGALAGAFAAAFLGAAGRAAWIAVHGRASARLDDKGTRRARATAASAAKAAAEAELAERERLEGTRISVEFERI